MYNLIHSLYNFLGDVQKYFNRCGASQLSKILFLKDYFLAALKIYLPFSFVISSMLYANLTGHGLHDLMLYAFVCLTFLLGNAVSGALGGLWLYVRHKPRLEALSNSPIYGDYVHCPFL